MIETTGDIGFAFRVLNRRLREHGTRFGSMCTIAAVEVAGDRTPRVYSAGHPLPVRRRGAVAEEVGEPGPMLGFLDEVDIAPSVVELAPGDQLILYTDGVLDAVRSGERFGEDRLLEVVAQLPAGDGTNAADDLVAAVSAYLDGEQSDDIAVLGLLRSPVPAVSSRTPESDIA
jgi:phosphoserine phosphatase RsbU/P